jgi:hypothetical protein
MFVWFISQTSMPGYVWKCADRKHCPCSWKCMNGWEKERGREREREGRAWMVISTYVTYVSMYATADEAQAYPLQCWASKELSKCQAESETLKAAITKKKIYFGRYNTAWPAESNLHLGVTCRFHLQCRRLNHIENLFEGISKSLNIPLPLADYVTLYPRRSYTCCQSWS